MSVAWKMYNMWPWWVTSKVFLILGTRSTIVSFVCLTHIGGHCLVSYCMELGWLSDSQLCHPFSTRLSCLGDMQSSAMVGVTVEHDVFVYNIYTKYWYCKKMHNKSRWNFAEGFFPSTTAIYKHMNWFWTTDCILDRNRICRKCGNWGKIITSQCWFVDISKKILF